VLDKAELVALVTQATGKARLQLYGHSMRPLLRAGMVVEIEPLERGVRRGDILVYRTPSGLVAHRLLRAGSEECLICGDAQPERLEVVPMKTVLGCVRAIWASDAAGAPRVDGPVFRLAGRVLAQTRPLRALWRFGAGRLSTAFGPASRSAAPAFRTLVGASVAFEALDYDAAVEHLARIALPELLEVVKRHHASGFVARWLDRAVEAGVPVPSELHESFRRVRLTNAMQAERVLQRVADVARKLDAAGIDAIFLKGGARLAAAESDADLQFSGDVDVLVPESAGRRAVTVLRSAGYAETYGARRVAFFAERLQHHAPLFAADSNVPVEVHVALVAPGRVTNALSYAQLAPFARTVTGPAGDVRVLDDVAAAVHLAYHARDFRVWRDIVLLARKLRAFTLVERARFDGIVAREKRDAVRVRAAVAAADAVAGKPQKLASPVARYLSWAVAREEMPALLRRRAHIVEAVVARCPTRYEGLWQTSAQALGWLYNLILTPAVVRAARAQNDARGPAATIFDSG